MESVHYIHAYRCLPVSCQYNDMEPIHYIHVYRCSPLKTEIIYLTTSSSLYVTQVIVPPTLNQSSILRLQEQLFISARPRYSGQA